MILKLFINSSFLDGNIPKKQSYGLFVSQLVRFARINSSFNGFIDSCKGLVIKLVKQNLNPAALRKRSEVLVENYFDIWGKYANQVFK